uniref:Protein Star-like n=1 Tax=Hirondellea gigas TaxID=1518452 RepID=A0A2P2I5J0_9CRUS
MLRHCSAAKLVLYFFVFLFLLMAASLHLITVRGPDGLAVHVQRRELHLYHQRTSENVTQLPADSPELLKHLMERVLVPPSRVAYNLRFGGQHSDQSEGQSRVIDDLLGGMRNGFYVECGAYTGDVLSNSLFFELDRGWEGLLIEPDDRNFNKLLSRNRKAWTANACLGASTTPANIMLLHLDNSYGSHIMSKSSEDVAAEVLHNHLTSLQIAHCFPLYSFLLALNHTTIDYFSLDVEGLEYKVLEAIPWDKVNIKTLSVEFNMAAEGKDPLVKLMTSHGYSHYMELNALNAHDLIFVKSDLMKNVGTREKYPIIVTERPYKPYVRNSYNKLFQ